MLRLFFLVLLVPILSNAQTFTKLNSGTNTSLRGLSVVDKSVAWTSGSNGWFARTTDGGKTWKWTQLEKYKAYDFRDIEGFSATDALMVNAGSPAVILKTIDGGETWQETYRNDSPDIFLDGIDFSNPKCGIAFGDPIGHRLQILRTVNEGLSWQDISSNLTERMLEGEAGFAASGTTVKTLKSKVWIATGGTQSRIFYSPDFGNNWSFSPCPILQGKNSTGVFSLAFYNKAVGVVIGGDYLADTLRTKNMLYTIDRGKTWSFPEVAPFGYRSAICYLTKKKLLSTGPKGTDLSEDRGKTWKNISPKGFNSIAKSRDGKLILLSGSKGEIYSISL